jgi:hypothetical protein
LSHDQLHLQLSPLRVELSRRSCSPPT